MTPILIPQNALAGADEIQLRKPEIAIGRGRQNDVILDDPSVSRVHAKIRITAAGCVIEDNNSLHGIRVNGQPVNSRRLETNDLIDIGLYKYRFVESPDGRIEPASIMLQQIDHLQLLLEVTRQINSSLEPTKVLEHVIDAVIRVTHAERGFLMTINQNNELRFRVGRNLDQTSVETGDFPGSLSALNRVKSTGEPFVRSDTMDVHASNPSISMVDMGLRSVMCVPFKTGNRLAGLIYVDSHQKAKRFSAEDLELFESLASQAAVVIEKSELHEQLQQYNVSLEEQVRQRTQELMRTNERLTESYVELQKAQGEVIQAEKLAAVGRLAAGIAHEINSPLGVITSNLDTLGHLIRRIETGRADQPMDILQGIARTSAAASVRLQRITKAFQAYAGLDEAEMKALNINDAIETVLILLEHEFGNRVTVVKEFGNLELLKASPGRVHQVFMSLLHNAAQSIENRGEVRIRSEQLGEQIHVTIQDTGRGMTPEQVATIFDPGFSQKGDRIGARLGLIITAQIVRETGGDIQFRSMPGVGTTVTLSFRVEPLSSGAVR